MNLLLEGDVDVEDISVDDGVAEIIAAPGAFNAIVAIFEKEGITPSESTITMIPDSTTMVTELNVAKSVQKFIDAVDEYDDCTAIYNDMELADDVAEALENEE